MFCCIDNRLSPCDVLSAGISTFYFGVVVTSQPLSLLSLPLPHHLQQKPFLVALKYSPMPTLL